MYEKIIAQQVIARRTLMFMDGQFKVSKMWEKKINLTLQIDRKIFKWILNIPNSYSVTILIAVLGKIL